jgi:hypothetical protein
MFDVSLSWINGLFQIAVYSAVVVVILWVMSKIEIKEKGRTMSADSFDELSRHTGHAVSVVEYENRTETPSMYRWSVKIVMKC